MGSLTGSNDLKLNQKHFLTGRSIRQCEHLAREVCEASLFRVFKSSIDNTPGQLSPAVFMD